MAEFWLISAPGEKTCQQTWDRMNAATSHANNLATNNKFTIPDLKKSVQANRRQQNFYLYSLSVVKKVAHYMADILEDSRDKVLENLLANGVDLVTYLTRFQWDLAKYPIKQSLKNISEIISKQVTQIDNDLKARALAYNSIKGNLQNLTRKKALLFEDQDSGLFSVTLFQKAIDDFRLKAKENKFIVRDFQYNEIELNADKEEMTRLSTDKKKQFV
ncbi:V-type proton ATPase subunit C 1-A [Bagarius yarrelli]|uniref:V-type proton ATPase subunit C n=1 Tax=Bagarius yarrelli TaxID=175774 RepID=A0A556TNT1_BAGYA|nr:V-type proton ATPase subunit C 1-A [Bagarius yarrelli]